jgi:restriction endonuclease Mrr
LNPNSCFLLKAESDDARFLSVLPTGGLRLFEVPTMDAKREAIRDGANPIELVDGEKLVRMFEKLELGVKPKVVYEVDMDFFNDFK